MINYLKNFEEALERTYVAAMFDIDGTLTEPGHQEIPDELLKFIGELSVNMPRAICTGRRFEGMLDRLQLFIDVAPDPAKARKNWYLFLENGSIGIRYNSEKNEYERFYEIGWPEEEISMTEVVEKLKPKVEEIDPCDIRLNECSLGVYAQNRPNYSKKELASTTKQFAAVAHEVLKEFSGRGQVHVIDSGVAMHIICANGDKDRGIHEFGQILNREHGTSLDDQARDILIIGDQPGEGYNDAKFLEGKYGTPFTADRFLEDKPYPIPIFDDQGGQLCGPTATLSLLKRLKFA